METPDLHNGEVLWIDPETIMRMGWPNGFPFRVVRVSGLAGNGRYWVYGDVLDPACGTTIDVVTLPVLPSHPRAIRCGNAFRQRRPGDPDDPPPVIATAAVPAPYKVEVPRRLQGHPPLGYRRVVV